MTMRTPRAVAGFAGIGALAGAFAALIFTIVHQIVISPIWFARFWHRLRIPIPIETWTGTVKLLHAPDFTLPPTRRGTRTILTVHDLSFVREPDAFTS